MYKQVLEFYYTPFLLFWSLNFSNCCTLMYIVHSWSHRWLRSGDPGQMVYNPVHKEAHTFSNNLVWFDNILNSRVKWVGLESSHCKYFMFVMNVLYLPWTFWKCYKILYKCKDDLLYRLPNPSSLLCNFWLLQAFYHIQFTPAVMYDIGLSHCVSTFFACRISLNVF